MLSVDHIIISREIEHAFHFFLKKKAHGTAHWWTERASESSVGLGGGGGGGAARRRTSAGAARPGREARGTGRGGPASSLAGAARAWRLARAWWSGRWVSKPLLSPSFRLGIRGSHDSYGICLRESSRRYC